MPQYQLQLQFATHESVARVIVKPGDDIVPAQPHPPENQHKQSAAALYAKSLLMGF